MFFPYSKSTFFCSVAIAACFMVSDSLISAPGRNKKVQERLAANSLEQAASIPRVSQSEALDRLQNDTTLTAGHIDVYLDCIDPKYLQETTLQAIEKLLNMKIDLPSFDFAEVLQKNGNGCEYSLLMLVQMVEIARKGKAAQSQKIEELLAENVKLKEQVMAQEGIRRQLGDLLVENEALKAQLEKPCKVASAPKVAKKKTTDSSVQVDSILDELRNARTEIAQLQRQLSAREVVRKDFSLQYNGPSYIDHATETTIYKKNAAQQTDINEPAQITLPVYDEKAALLQSNFDALYEDWQDTIFALSNQRTNLVLKLKEFLCVMYVHSLLDPLINNSSGDYSEIISGSFAYGYPEFTQWLATSPAEIGWLSGVCVTTEGTIKLNLLNTLNSMRGIFLPMHN